MGRARIRRRARRRTSGRRTDSRKTRRRLTSSPSPGPLPPCLLLRQFDQPSGRDRHGNPTQAWLTSNRSSKSRFSRTFITFPARRLSKGRHHQRTEGMRPAFQIRARPTAVKAMKGYTTMVPTRKCSPCTVATTRRKLRLLAVIKCSTRARSMGRQGQYLIGSPLGTTRMNMRSLSLWGLLSDRRSRESWWTLLGVSISSRLTPRQSASPWRRVHTPASPTSSMKVQPLSGTRLPRRCGRGTRKSSTRGRLRCGLCHGDRGRKAMKRVV